MFSVGAFFLYVRAARGRAGMAKGNSSGITKARFQIFKAPFCFVGWLAPAYGKDVVNSNGITGERRSQFQRDHQGWPKAIPAGSRKLAFRYLVLLLIFCRMAGASLQGSAKSIPTGSLGKDVVNSKGITFLQRGWLLMIRAFSLFLGM